MNKTVALPELAAHIACVAGTDIDSATRFAVALFAAVESDLSSGNAATVPGLGTFRCADGAVSFEPDASLAAAVNAPFAMFEPIELPPDVPAEVLAPAAEAPAAPAEPEVPAVIEIEVATEPEPEAVPEPEPQAEPQAEEPEQEPASEATGAAQADEACDSASDDYADYTPHRSPWPWIAAAACLLVGLAAGYWIGSRFGAPRPIIIAAAEASIVEPSEENAADTTILPADSATQPAAAQVRDTVPAEAPKAAAEKTDTVYDTVTSARFLTTIARDHYGRKDFWVFIYEANSGILKHPNRIRPGTRIVVPDLGPHAALDPEMRARAHKLANEIYRRYDL